MSLDDDSQYKYAGDIRPGEFVRAKDASWVEVEDTELNGDLVCLIGATGNIRIVKINKRLETSQTGI